MRTLKHFLETKKMEEWLVNLAEFMILQPKVPVEEDTSTEPVYATKLLKRIRYKP